MTIAAIKPVKKPLTKASTISLNTKFRSSFRSSFPKAIPWITKASVWEAEFPPIPVIIGLIAANATTFEIVSSKSATVAEARKAVTRLIINQGKRFLSDSLKGPPISSLSWTPPIRKISSWYSSCKTSTISSIVMIPSNTCRWLTTGTTDKLYLAESCATSSWSTSGVTLTIWVFINSLSFISASWINKSRISIQPTSEWCTFLINKVSITSVLGEISLNLLRVAETVRFSFKVMNSVVIRPPAVWGS